MVMPARAADAQGHRCATITRLQLRAGEVVLRNRTVLYEWRRLVASTHQEIVSPHQARKGRMHVEPLLNSTWSRAAVSIKIRLVCRPSHLCVCRVGTPPAR